MKKIKNAASWLSVLGGASFAVAGIIFLVINRSIIRFFPLIVTLFCFFSAAFAVAVVLLRKKDCAPFCRVLCGVLTAVDVAVMVGLTVLFKVFFMFQPVCCSTAVEASFFACGYFAAASLLVSFVFGTKKPLCLASAALVACLFSLFIGWATLTDYSDYGGVSEEPLYLFTNGESGYFTYRIPSLIALDKDVLSEKCGFFCESDMLVAFAEGRKDSSSDEGRIDLVMKVFRSGERSVPDVVVLKSGGETIEKYGNPTPVFDKETGKIHLFYIRGAKENGFRYETYRSVLEIGTDGKITETETEKITFDGFDGELIPGPGKGTVLSTGRLCVPFYEEKGCFLLLSDDHGETWRRGEIVGEGNECDATETADGKVLFVTRDNLGCTTLHPDEYIRLSLSEDGGETWEKRQEETTVPTPICEASLNRLSDGTILLTNPACHLTRADLSLSYSCDGGKTFFSEKLYDGASGYSCIAVDSDDNVFVLAEVGKVCYNEALVLLECSFLKR